MRYVRDVRRGDNDALTAEKTHVIEQLAAVADENDDPSTYRGRVSVWVESHPDDPAMLRIVGELDAPPRAPYLREDFNPLAGIDPELLREAGLVQE